LSRADRRGGYNWTDLYPWIVEAARKVRQRRFVLDGDAVILGVDAISVRKFNID
jgi:bifunctional non-homologous end joining protein LigD